MKPGRAYIPFSNIILLLTTIIMLCGCGDSQFTVQKNITPAESILPPSLTISVTEALGHYFNVKDALIATRSKVADIEAQAMSTNCITIRDNLLKLNKANDMTFDQRINVHQLNQTVDTILNNLHLITSVSDESCEVKRVHFQHLSDAFYHFLKEIKLKNITIYHVLCPMALNEQGAFWMSQFRGIKNPYFGRKMLSCGVIADSIH